MKREDCPLPSGRNVTKGHEAQLTLKDIDDIRELAKCGIWHNYGNGLAEKKVEELDVLIEKIKRDLFNI